jgi:hypothetical protein
MCCGSKRSAWRSVLASSPAPRAQPAPIASAPAPPIGQADRASEVAAPTRDGPIAVARRRSASPLGRRWGLTS